VTKAGIYVPCSYHPERRTAQYDATGARLVKSLEKSLRLLGTDRLELFLVHRPDWLTRADDTAAGLNQLVRAGKIRAAGVSNYSVPQFDLLNAQVEQPLATNQIEFHLLRPDPIDDGTLHQCEKLGLLPMAWSPLAGGRLLDPQQPAAQRLAAAAKTMSARYPGATLEQLAYAWIMAHPSRPLPIIGTNQLARLRRPRRPRGSRWNGKTGMRCGKPPKAARFRKPAGGTLVATESDTIPLSAARTDCRPSPSRSWIRRSAPPNCTFR